MAALFLGEGFSSGVDSRKRKKFIGCLGKIKRNLKTGGMFFLIKNL